MAIQAPSKRAGLKLSDGDLRRAFTLGIGSLFDPSAALTLREENRPFVVVRKSAFNAGRVRLKRDGASVKAAE